MGLSPHMSVLLCSFVELSTFSCVYAVVCQPMHYYLLPMVFNKHPIHPYIVSTYQALFHCMKTAFLVEADSQTCIWSALSCNLMPPSSLSPSLPNSPPSSVFSCSLPQPHACHHFFCSLPFHSTPYVCLFLPSPSPSLTLPRFTAGDQSGEAR